MRHIIHYVRNEKGMPVACLAFRDVFDTPYCGYIDYGISIHHPDDVWNRKLARQIAIGRMVESPFRIENIVAHDDWNISRVIAEILLDIKNNRSVPRRLMREVVRNL